MSHVALYIPLTIMATTLLLPYSVSTGSSFTAFKKLQGTQNYVKWHNNMVTVLMTLQQWGVVDKSITAPAPVDPANPMAAEIQELADWEVRKMSVFMEISFQVADSVKNVLGNTRNPVAAWEALEKHFGARQEGIQSSLIAKLQLADWDGQAAISTHCDYMVDLCTQLEDTGMMMTDQAFYSYFAEWLPKSLDLFITLYKDSTYNVDRLCDKFAKYEMRKKVRASKTAKSQSASDGSVTLFGQQQEKRRERDLSNVTCYGCGKKGHLKHNCPEPSKQELQGGKPVQDTSSNSKADASQSKGVSMKKPPSGTLYTAMAYTGMCADDGPTAKYYVDLGASKHLIPSKVYLQSYREFSKPVEISVANDGQILAYGSGHLWVVTLINGQEHKVNLEDVYYAPQVHVRLLSMGKLEDQGWDVCLCKGGMELRDHNGGLFADIAKTNKVYLVELRLVASGAGLAGWMTNSGEDKSTYQELLGRLGKVTMTATARGGSGPKALLWTWHCWLGHLSFKTIMELAQEGASGLEITNIPARIPGLDACFACVAAKMVHLPHKEGRSRATKYLEWVYIDIAGPMHIPSAGGRLYLYVAVDDYTCAIYTQPLFLKLDAPEAFKAFRAAAENESRKQLREVMMNNARELSMGEMRDICKCDSIKLCTTVLYHPASNGVAECAIEVLTVAAHAMLHDAGLPQILWAEAFSTVTYLRNRTPTRALDRLTPFELLYGMKPDLADLRTFGDHAR